jgi:hypothetical protein
MCIGTKEKNISIDHFTNWLYGICQCTFFVGVSAVLIRLVLYKLSEHYTFCSVEKMNTLCGITI